jgi:hypothetical protein
LLDLGKKSGVFHRNADFLRDALDQLPLVLRKVAFARLTTCNVPAILSLTMIGNAAAA